MRVTDPNDAYPTAGGWRGYAVALAATAAATGLGILAEPWMPHANLSVAYLMVVLAVAIKIGLRPAIMTSVLCFFAFNFFFTEPRYSLTIVGTDSILTVVFFLIAAVVVSRMAVERTRLANEAATARVEAERERLRAALLTSLSHDLRTPLVSVLGAASSLASFGETLDAEARRDLAQTIQDEAERLNRFVQNLLDMTRLEAGALTPRADWADLRDILAAAAKRAERLARRQTLEVAVEAGMPLLKVDAVLLEQAVFNLLDNACKYAPEGTRVGIAGRQAADAIVIEVVDQGPGIPPADRAKVFDLFYRAAQADSQSGTGLGLGICRGIVEAHGGSVHIEAGDGGTGTRAVVRLPLPPAPALEAQEDEG